ncbi:MAG: PEP-CTERM sorting domain-containing protein [Planctomycetes bacterium]|nr:PEP-CTERM sorting domain-containing protein [Planctomycetota bacterium]
MKAIDHGGPESEARLEVPGPVMVLEAVSRFVSPQTVRSVLTQTGRQTRRIRRLPAANAGMPDDYSFGETGHTYHMVAFLDTPNTTLLANNDEPNNILAFREYDNLGSFNYMVLDLGIRNGDQTQFITPWVGASLYAARIAEPATLSLLVLGGLAALRRRR